MDSVTQIVLGAAVGELAQGRKLGNRAMIWGAIAGTIPDLDVFVGKLYTDPVDELAFHRGITHSFFFAVTFSLGLSYLTYWIYDKGNYKKLNFAYGTVLLLLGAMAAVAIVAPTLSLGLAGAAALAIPTLCYGVYRYLKYRDDDTFEDFDLGVRGWYLLFFWCIFTHPLLDCFTVYGTQVFLPFSDYRVSFDNISVADPLYTVPFLLCLIIASILSRGSQYRRYFNIAGIVMSSVYMCWTFYNKNIVNEVVEHTLTQQGITYDRYMTSPTILNNILWSTTVETDSVFYQGQYSLLDQQNTIDLVAIPKNHSLIDPTPDDHTINTLRWFSNDYYGIMTRRDGRLQLNDLRYGSFSGSALDENDFIFRFVLDQDSLGGYQLVDSEAGPPDDVGPEMFTTLISRIRGNRPPPVYKTGAVVSAHGLASEVGLSILKQDGNAFDAAVAVHFALAVVYPRAGNLGGGGFATIHTATGINTTLDFREKAPLGAHRHMYTDELGAIIPKLSLEGELAAGVPGAVKGMQTLFDSLCTLPLSTLLSPAIRLAADGYAISDNEAKRLNQYRPQFDKYNDSITPYTARSEWTAGDTLVNHDLATTMQRLLANGLDEFYDGQTAALIAAHSEKSAGLITTDDLRQYSAIWRKPTSCLYHEYEVISMPPPSSGGIALCQLLHGVESLRADTLPQNSPEYIHLLSELEKRVFTIRNQVLGDPDYVEIDDELLLSDEFCGELFSTITDTCSNDIAASVQEQDIVKEAYETTHFSIVDQHGNAISVTTTLNGNYGSFVVVPGTGILLNNQMDDFAAKPGVANQYGLLGSEKNAIAPGKRMLSSMSPTIVLYEGKPAIVLGSPGGPTIITAVLQTLLNSTKHGMSIQEAVDAARFHDQGYPRGILIEEGRFATAVLEKLQVKGHNIRTTKYMGAVEAITIDTNGVIRAAADYTRGKDDEAAGY